jgi:acyl-coenzyme A synthetase/AMP-(fatty) acid ligase
MEMGDLIHRAKPYANILAEAGVKKGDVCALVLRHNCELYPIYMGLDFLGALPAVLAYTKGYSGAVWRNWLLSEALMVSIAIASGRSSLSFISAESS